MSHIEGHIDSDTSSCGILTVIGIHVKLYFVPPSFEVKVGDRVGFHPIMIGDSVLAIDIVRWPDHTEAETNAKNIIRKVEQEYAKEIAHSDSPVEEAEINRIEELHNQYERRNILNHALSNGGFSHEDHKDVIRKTLRYFKTSDFKNFYLNNGVADAETAKQRINEIYQKPVLLKTPFKSPWPLK